MPLSKSNFLVAIVAACATALPAHAFLSSPRPASARLSQRLDSDAGGGLEELEFTIHPDGRVTETVRGVKGKRCQDVTKEINKQLGNVVETSPTEEMFEEEVKVEQTLQQKEGGGGWDSSSSW